MLRPKSHLSRDGFHVPLLSYQQRPNDPRCLVREGDGDDAYRLSFHQAHSPIVTGAAPIFGETNYRGCTDNQ